MFKIRLAMVTGLTYDPLFTIKSSLLVLTWGPLYDSFGEPVEYLTKVNYLTQHHYLGNWDVLRPAKELPELNVLGSEELLRLEKEAELIIEGWAAQNG